MLWRTTVLSIFLISVYTAYYFRDIYLTDERNIQYVRKPTEYPHDESIVIFPKNFTQLQTIFGFPVVEDLESLPQYYFDEFGSSQDQDKLHIFQYYDSNDNITKNEYYQSNSFTNVSLNFFNSSKLDNGESSCEDGTINESIQLSPYKQIDSDILRAISILRKQMDSDPAFKDVAEYIESDIDQLIYNKILEKHFFKFIGTSVWLEQFGVHYMVSRISFTKNRDKSRPQLSLFYAQIFDENWNELKDVELIMPITVEGLPKFKNIHYPSFVPLPFHKRKHTQASYGVEDPRLFLTKNRFGFDEPMIIYNTYQRTLFSLSEASSGLDQQIKLNLGLLRSMYFCYPFQFELGMPPSIEGFYNPFFDSVLFTKIAFVEKDERTKISKNWTPFINTSERVNGVDKFIYLVFRWSKLEVLKCELIDFTLKGKSKCQVVFEKDKVNGTNAEVGDFRGGTELIHVNQYIPNLESLDVWVGIARTAIKGCGCGMRFYRPHIVLLTRNSENDFNIAYISSYITFGVPVIGFEGPHDICSTTYPNVLLPNGISSWFKSPDTNSDYLTISLSADDTTNYVVTIKDFLPTIEKLIHNIGSNITTLDRSIDCALEDTSRFCKQLGIDNPSSLSSSLDA